jgi:hypothetical protein
LLRFQERNGSKGERNTDAISFQRTKDGMKSKSLAGQVIELPTSLSHERDHSKIIAEDDESINDVFFQKKEGNEKS